MLEKSSCQPREQQVTVGKDVVYMDPFRCRMWVHHDRLEDYLTEEACHAEIESFSLHGQLIPVLGRQLRNDPSHEVVGA